MTEDEMVGWHHQLDGHEFDQAPGVGDGQGGLVCSSPWGRKDLDMTERQCKEIELIYNIVLLSGVQHSDSVMHTYMLVSYFFHILFPYRLLNIGPCAIQ